MTASGNAIVVNREVTNFPLVLPGNIPTTDNKATLLFKSDNTMQVQTPTSLATFLNWSPQATIRVTTNAFDTVELKLTGVGLLDSITASESTQWGNIRTTIGSIQLNKADGYHPSFAPMTVNIVQGQTTTSYSATVGYLPNGWHTHVHFDGTIELTRPPLKNSGDYNVFNHNGASEDISPKLPDLEWHYDPAFNAEAGTETVIWDDEPLGYTSVINSFDSVNGGHSKIPIFVAVGPVVTQAATFAGVAVSNFKIQMMGYNYNQATRFWEARIVATRADNGQKIIFDVRSDLQVTVALDNQPVFRSITEEVGDVEPVEILASNSTDLYDLEEDSELDITPSDIAELVEEDVVEEVVEEVEPYPVPIPFVEVPVHPVYVRVDEPVPPVAFTSEFLDMNMAFTTGPNGELTGTGSIVLKNLGTPNDMLTIQIDSAVCETTVPDENDYFLRTWTITGHVAADWTVAGFTFNGVTLTLRGIAEGYFDPYNIEIFDWSATIDVAGTISILDDLQVTLEVDVDFTDGITGVGFVIHKEFEHGTLDGTIHLYMYQYDASDFTFMDMPTDIRTYAQYNPALTCDDEGAFMELNGTAVFTLKQDKFSGITQKPTFTVSVAVNLCDISSGWMFIGKAEHLEFGTDIVIDKVELVARKSSEIYYVQLHGAGTVKGVTGSIHINADTTGQLFVTAELTEAFGENLIIHTQMSFLYSGAGIVADGMGIFTLHNFGDDHSTIVVEIDVEYCSVTTLAACKHSKTWYAKGSFTSDLMIYGQQFSHLSFEIYKDASWGAKLGGTLAIPSIGVTSTVDITLQGATVTKFMADFTDTLFNGKLYVHGKIEYVSKDLCLPGVYHTGTGEVEVKNLFDDVHIGSLDNFEGKASTTWKISCNNNGYFNGEVHASTNLKGFNFGGDHVFGISDALIIISREEQNKPIHFELSAKFYGMSNLIVRASLDLIPNQPNQFSILVQTVQNKRWQKRRTDRRRNTDERNAEAPGDILALLGKQDKEIVTSGGAMDFSSQITPAKGDSGSMYYDMFSNAKIKNVLIEFISSPQPRIHANLDVLLYNGGVDLQLFISLEKKTKWEFAAGLILDLTQLSGTKYAILGEMSEHISTAMVVISSVGGKYKLNNVDLVCMAGSVTVYTKLKITGTLTSFKENANMGDHVGTDLTAMASLSSTELTLLVELSSNSLPTSDSNSVVLRKLWLSLQIKRSPFEVKVGLVANADITMGHEYNKPTQRVVFPVVLQLYLVGSPGSFGLGVFFGVCAPIGWQSNRFEIAHEIYILFPIKFKFEMQVFPALAPRAIGFAGGVQIGSGSNTALSAYAQVFLNAANPAASNFYLEMGHFELHTILEQLIGPSATGKLPSWLSRLISFDYLEINYSTETAPASNTKNKLTEPGAAVSSSKGQDCATDLALRPDINSPYPGVISVDIHNLNIGDGFIVVNRGQFRIDTNAKTVYMALEMDPITKIPGFTLTNYDGTSGPSFYLDAALATTPIEFRLQLSFHMKLFGLVDEAVKLNITDTIASGVISKEFGVDGHITFSFTVNYRKPWEGLHVEVQAEHIISAIVREMAADFLALGQAFSAILKDVDESLQVAQEALAAATKRLEDARRQVDQKLGSAKDAVARAQGAVNSLSTECHRYGHRCGWRHPWDCVRCPVCWVEYGVAYGVLETAELALKGAQAVVDTGLTLLEDALGVANATLGQARKMFAKIDDINKAAGGVLTNMASGANPLFDFEKLRASFDMQSGTAPTLEFEAKFKFLSDTYDTHFRCQIGSPAQIAKCLRPLLESGLKKVMGLLDSLFDKRSISHPHRRAISRSDCPIPAYYTTTTMEIAADVIDPVPKEFPGCVFNIPDINLIMAENDNFTGPLPEPAEISSVKSINLAYNQLCHNFSFANFPQLDWLDLSYNNFSGGVQSLVDNNPLIEYLALDGNPIEEDIYSLMPKMYNLQYASVRLSSAVEMNPVDFTHNQGLRFMLEFQLDSDSHLCGDCSLVMQHSGRCHNYSCSSTGSITALYTKLHDAIEDKLYHHGYEHIRAGSLNIVQTIQRRDFSALVTFNYSGISVPHELIEEALTELEEDGTVKVVDVVPACPFSLMGVACNYQCRLGGGLTAPVDGKGGHIAPIYLGMRHKAVYDHVRARCNLPLDCGRSCTAALQRVLYECQDFADSYHEEYRANCEKAIKRAKFYCSAVSAATCLDPIVIDFKRILDSVSNAPLIGNNNQRILEFTVASPSHLPKEEIDANINLVLAVLTTATKGQVEHEHSFQDFEKTKLFMKYEILIDPSLASTAYTNIQGISQYKSFRNQYRKDIDIIPGTFTFTRNVAFNRYSSQTGASGPKFFETSLVLDGNIDSYFQLPQNDYLMVQLDTVRLSSRVVIVSHASKVSSFGGFEILLYDTTNCDGIFSSFHTAPEELSSAIYTLYLGDGQNVGCVKVRSTKTSDHSSIAEVQVYAEDYTCTSNADCHGNSTCAISGSAVSFCSCPGSHYTGLGCAPVNPTISFISPPGLFDSGLSSTGVMHVIVQTAVEAGVRLWADGVEYPASPGSSVIGFPAVITTIPGIYSPNRHRLKIQLPNRLMSNDYIFNYNVPSVKTASRQLIFDGAAQEFCGGNWGPVAYHKDFEVKLLGTNVPSEGISCTNVEVYAAHNCMRCNVVGTSTLKAHHVFHTVSMPQAGVTYAVTNFRSTVLSMWFTAWYGIPNTDWRYVFPNIHENTAFKPSNHFFGNVAPSSSNRIFLALYINSAGAPSMIYEYEGTKVAPTSYKPSGQPTGTHFIVAAFWGSRTHAFSTVTTTAQSYYNNAVADSTGRISFAATSAAFGAANGSPELIVFYRNGDAFIYAQNTNVGLWKY